MKYKLKSWVPAQPIFAEGVTKGQTLRVRDNVLSITFEDGTVTVIGTNGSMVVSTAPGYGEVLLEPLEKTAEKPAENLEVHTEKDPVKRKPAKETNAKTNK